MTPDGYLRVSDAERDAVAGELREHHAEGRLDVAELSERLDAVFAARTRDDLAAVTTDLPGRGRPRWAPEAGHDDFRSRDWLRDRTDLVGRPTGRVGRRHGPVAAVLAVVAVLWLGGAVFGMVFDPHHVGPGPLFVLVAVMLFIRSRRRRREESSRDRDRYLPR